MLQRNFKLYDFPVHSVCFLHNFFFRSEQNRKFRPFFTTVTNLKKFSPSTFRDIFDRNLNFPNILRVQDCYLRMRKPGARARVHATYFILSLIFACISRDSVALFSGPGRARQETVSSHLKGRFPWNRFCGKDRLWAGFHIIVCVVRFVSVASNFLKRQRRLYGNALLRWESSISDDPYARIVSIARIASVVWEERFHIIVPVASKNLKRQRRSLR